MNYRVLLFYKYTTIEDPESFAKEHLAFGKEIGIKGRILVAKEGINGTLSGTIEATDAYMEKMEADPVSKESTTKSMRWKNTPLKIVCSTAKRIGVIELRR